ncbi:MAG: hypothetical protein J0H92_00455 [Sphingobacteriales bacterium]|nr:hypothetical protein [Sphingobacteriales bacterium]OJW34013.1 MAG: hypothetical protein BGO54_04865 [Sphingobacteriales bacterium 46-32]
MVLNDVYAMKTRNVREEVKLLQSKIEKIQTRRTTARDLLLSGTIEPQECKEIKTRRDQQLASFEG